MKENLSNFLENYTTLEKIGEGSYGKVYKAIEKDTNRYVAIKKCIPSSVLREITVLKNLKHENIISLLDFEYFPLERLTIFILEYAEKDLSYFIKKKLNREQRKFILFQIVNGLNYMQSQGFVHRDIKPNNILINQDYKIKIIDFGLSRLVKKPLGPFTNEVETLCYRSPELLLGECEYFSNIDVWALGCVLAEMIMSKRLFEDYTQIAILLSIFNVFGTPTEEEWPEITKFDNYSYNFPK